MTDLFDFKDGNGPVPAHRHSRGAGWVADTAYVSDTAYVGSTAKVYGSAKVLGRSWICDNSRVYGNAVVLGGCCTYLDAEVFGQVKLFGGINVFGRVSSCRDVICAPHGSFCGTLFFFRDRRSHDPDSTRRDITCLLEEELAEAALEIKKARSG